MTQKRKVRLSRASFPQRKSESGNFFCTIHRIAPTIDDICRRCRGLCPMSTEKIFSCGEILSHIKICTCFVVEENCSRAIISTSVRTFLKLLPSTWKAILLHMFWHKIYFVVIYTVSTTHTRFCRDWCAFVWRKNLPKSLVCGAKMTMYVSVCVLPFPECLCGLMCIYRTGGIRELPQLRWTIL